MDRSAESATMPATEIAPPGNLCEMLLHDIAALLVTSRLVQRTLLEFRPECQFSPVLSETLDSLVALSESGEQRLREPLLDAGAVLPALTEETTIGTVISGFISNAPTSRTPAVLAAEVVANFRLLVQHIELKARLVAEVAVLVGQNRLAQALLEWSGEWRACGQILRTVAARVRAQAYIADVKQPT